ncbi:DUF924 domain-containing protein [Sneathiella marina]|uniref:DUF924 domain-containing protein n=1 Tax=Sneathiella marina TaxID=2950108 RepID=A0ABY4W8Q8_9PROT|nr:DUF924 family protein [Sneathiella marina]USG62312.1 DUF924 domain-containing protein [Sneathiella marina]
MDRVQAILDFWFLPENHPEFGKTRTEWFLKNPSFDTQIRTLFLSDLEAAAAGHYLAWTESKKGCLALIILFDQFPRNIFRESKRAFETDGKALEITRHLMASGFFKELNLVQKQFVILPFEHSEDMDNQKRSLQLFIETGNTDLINYAQAHYDIIERFGRFPHRNNILGRTSTPAEEEFLKKPGSSF